MFSAASVATKIPTLPPNLVDLKINLSTRADPRPSLSLFPVNNCPELRKLTLLLRGCNVDLSNIKEDNKIEELTMKVREGVTEMNMYNLTRFSNLRTLWSNADIHSLVVPLREIPLLQSVTIDVAKLLDISGLADCPSLEEVNLTGCISLKDVSPLATCYNLKRLFLYGCKKVKDITSLENLPNLQYARLGNTGLTTKQKLIFRKKTGAKIVTKMMIMAGMERTVMDEPD